ncbi:hypothetical protein [Polaribacter ponticola]|uniref:Uncharacterized protein n=1 Tax=Polaribacter ponticola TaxID=2978475 RepID=A0ABT5S8V1_9FLAO|nr:hypothetical protein [Polaribacter sp. MSW5]MDD7912960.1 hypothetical protein [Polaribacter sp. MSW5]MDD7913742.1 hypothetical protein [Polaribacter sp. MSW5]
MQEVNKYLKVKYTCKGCKKEVTKRLIVTVKKPLNTTDLNFSVLNNPDKLTHCSKCTEKSFDVAYSFYHVEKLITNG